jgi:acyl-CoA thioester hydrolase
VVQILQNKIIPILGYNSIFVFKGAHNFKKQKQMTINFLNKTQVRVRYGETDQMGYCYYGNYAQFCEIGRVEALRNIGMPYSELEKQGVMLPVTKFEINYVHPAKYDDLLTITTYLRELRGPQILFDYEIKIGETLIATAFTSLVFVDKSTMKPVRPPKSFLNLIEPFLNK